MLVLSVIQGPDKGRVFQTPDHEPQLIGRSSEALPITDTTVSRRHAELTPDQGEWWIRDLASQNGTYVNGTRITERTRLKPGDQVRTGATLLVFGHHDMGQELDVVRLVKPDLLEADIEALLASNEDSMVLAEPEPRAAAAEHLRIIYRLTTLTTQLTEKQDLVRGVLELVFDEFKPERGFVMLLEEDQLKPVAEKGRLSSGAAPKPSAVRYHQPPKDKDERNIHVSRTILQHAVTKSEGVLSTNAMTDPRFASGDSVQQMHIRSAICSPIRFRDRTFGAIYIDSSIMNFTFTPEQLALMNAIGQHTGLALANQELHAEKLQTERLAAIGETVASLSHSIKNILQGLRGGADVVEMGLKKDDLKIAKGGWSILKRNVDRIMGLTLNMLAFSRQRKPEYELTKLGTLIEDCAQLLEGQCGAKGVALIVDADPEMPPIMLDPSLIHQAMMNLLANAVEAVDTATGAVTVRAMYQPARRLPSGGMSAAVAEVLVIDNGPGIPKEQRRHLFEPFHTTKGLRGTGLGLAVAKRVVQEHRGTIEVHSEEGRGTTFRVILPAETGGDPSATSKPGQVDLSDF